jgi:hypothetical protein
MFVLSVLNSLVKAVSDDEAMDALPAVVCSAEFIRLTAASCPPASELKAVPLVVLIPDRSRADDVPAFVNAVARFVALVELNTPDASKAASSVACAVPVPAVKSCWLNPIVQPPPFGFGGSMLSATDAFPLTSLLLTAV